MNHSRLSFVLLAVLTFTLALSGVNTAAAQPQKPPTPVIVQNTPLPVSGTVAVRDPALTAFMAYGGTDNPGMAGFDFLLYPAVPAGFRLVIEHVGVRCRTDADDEVVDVGVLTSWEGGGTFYMPIPVWQGPLANGRLQVLAAQPLRLYLDGASAGMVEIGISHSKPTAVIECHAAVTGYLVSLQ